MADKYFKVENKLLEETDYQLELKQSQWIADQCKAILILGFSLLSGYSLTRF